MEKTLAGSVITFINKGGSYDLIFSPWSTILNGPLEAKMEQTGIWPGNKMIIGVDAMEHLSITTMKLLIVFKKAYGRVYLHLFYQRAIIIS